MAELLTLLSYMGNLSDDVMLQPREEKQRYEMRDEILHDVKPLYPSKLFIFMAFIITKPYLQPIIEATLELFGSSANGFGIFSSDLDLCLLMNETYEASIY